MQESRLFKIVYHLLDEGQATARELAEKFEVSVRTIYRDIDGLSEAGIPIYAETGRNGGIRLMNDFVLDKVLLSENEKQEILDALQGYISARDIHHSGTLSKLSAIFNASAENWLEVDFSRWGKKSSDNEKYEVIKSAIIYRQVLKISYASSNEVIKGRTIYPLKLSYKSNAWYVKAYCTERNAFRIFKLTRIFDYALTDEKFSHLVFAKETEISEQEYNEIKLRFPKEMAYRVYDEFDQTEITAQENGDLLVSARMPEDGWLIGYLLSFGVYVEIIEPAYLRKNLSEEAKKIYEKHKP